MYEDVFVLFFLLRNFAQMSLYSSTQWKIKSTSEICPRCERRANTSSPSWRRHCCRNGPFLSIKCEIPRYRTQTSCKRVKVIFWNYRAYIILQHIAVIIASANNETGDAKETEKLSIRRQMRDGTRVRVRALAPPRHKQVKNEGIRIL